MKTQTQPPRSSQGKGKEISSSFVFELGDSRKLYRMVHVSKGVMYLLETVGEGRVPIKRPKRKGRKRMNCEWETESIGPADLSME